MPLQGVSNPDEINNNFNKNRDLRETCIKSLHEMEELKRVQELRVDELPRRRLIENQDTKNELMTRIQESQNEVNCMNDSRDFKGAVSTRFKKKVSLEEMNAHKEDRFLHGRQIAYLIHEYSRVTGANNSVKNFADLFTVVLRNDSIEEFDSKLDGILLSKTKIPSDDILEGLCKLRIRESDKLKSALELYKRRFIRKKPDLIITD